MLKIVARPQTPASAKSGVSVRNVGECETVHEKTQGAKLDAIALGHDRFGLTRKSHYGTLPCRCNRGALPEEKGLARKAG